MTLSITVGTQISAQVSNQTIKVPGYRDDYSSFDVELSPLANGGFKAAYMGLLVSECQGSCALQGYEIEINSKCEVVAFTKNKLKKFSPMAPTNHEGFTATEIERLVGYSNNLESLSVIYRRLGEGVKASNFAAAMSKASEVAFKGVSGAGNTLTTYFLHLGAIRQALAQRGLDTCKDFPVYTESQYPKLFPAQESH